jgi:hypothetical protein
LYVSEITTSTISIASIDYLQRRLVDQCGADDERGRRRAGKYEKLEDPADQNISVRGFEEDPE